MIEVLKEQFAESMSKEEKENRLREFLQVLTLKIVHDKGWFENLTFAGGTALRILFNMRRFSEDLDFSLTGPSGYDFKKLCRELQAQMELHGIRMEGIPDMEKTVHAVMLRFPGLLNNLGISPLPGQKLSIKLKIDTRPPEGGKIENSLVNKTYVFYIRHFDLSSLFAAKIAACFYRKYVKGRDFYDLIWYLSKNVEPDYELLNNAIRQTQGKAPGINAGNIGQFLRDHLEKIDLDKAAKDVERFLDDKNELKLFNHDLIKGSIDSVFR
ncbi:MAG: nucleotidyl transferase AbiEii/AbiGii toxin family protein [Candidatus Omnitrophica bacterium]|nr:nucleotidyl transferase AbiEii/AbiGii toxin family protein [Candidatus Omnitrophota bacterium]